MLLIVFLKDPSILYILDELEIHSWHFQRTSVQPEWPVRPPMLTYLPMPSQQHRYVSFEHLKNTYPLLLPLAFQTCHVWPVSSVFGQSSTSESNASQSDCNSICFFGRLMLDGGDGCTTVKIVVNWAHHWFCPETTYRAGLILRQSVLQTAVWLFGKESAIPSFIIPNYPSGVIHGPGNVCVSQALQVVIT